MRQCLHSPAADGQGDPSNTDGQSWDLYQRLIDDEVALANVDSGWTSQGPSAALPTCVVVMLHYPQDGEAGLPSPSTHKSMTQAADTLVAHLESELGARCVATVLGAGTYRAYFYAPRIGPGGDEPYRAAIAQTEGLATYAPQLRMEHDPQWKIVVEEAWPTATELRFNADMSVLMQLEEGGDDMTTPREIEHVAIFANSAAASGFSRWAGSHGYTLRGQPSRDANGQWLVEFAKVAPPDLDVISEQTAEITNAVDAQGGEYDGWGCRIVRGS